MNLARIIGTVLPIKNRDLKQEQNKKEKFKSIVEKHLEKTLSLDKKRDRQEFKKQKTQKKREIKKNDYKKINEISEKKELKILKVLNMLDK